MQSSRQIKQNAKLTLKYRWGNAVCAVAIGLCVSLLFILLEDLLVNTIHGALNTQTGELPGSNTFTGPIRITDEIILGTAVRIVFLLLSALLSYPVSLGIKRYFWGATAGADEKVSVVFDYFSAFSMYKRALSLALQIFFRILLYVLLLIIPFIVFTVLGQVVSADYLPFMSLLSYLSLAGASVCIIPILLRYFMAPYLLVNNDQISARECIRRSTEMTNGYKSAYFIFLFSFTGWILLCAFVLPVLYVLPYLQAGSAHFAHQLMQQHAKREIMEKSGNTQVIVY